MDVVLITAYTRIKTGVRIIRNPIQDLIKYYHHMKIFMVK